ncbi:MAG: O-antigen ligase family protein [Bacillota bacterium]
MSVGTETAWWRASTPVAPRTGLGGALPFWALMAFTIVLLLAPQYFIPALEPLHLAFLSAGLAGAAYVFTRLYRREAVLRFTTDTVLVICLAAWALAGVPLSYWPGGSLAMFGEIYFKALVVFWLLANAVDSVPKLKATAWILSLIAVPLSASAVRSFFSGGFHSEELSHGLDRIQGYGVALTGNPNDLALMLNLILPLTAALIFITRRPALRWLLAGTVCLDAIAIIATFSRAGFLTLGVVCFAYLYILVKRRQRMLAAVVIGGALLCVPLLPSAYLDRLGTITDIQADETGSAQARLGDSIEAMKFVASHPLTGAGLGMNILALNEARGATWTEVHDVYLEYAADLGLPGLVLFLLLLRTVVRGIGEAHRASAADPDVFDLHCLTQGLGVSLAGFVVAAFFYPDAYQFYFYYIAGLAIAARNIAVSHASIAPSGDASRPAAA